MAANPYSTLIKFTPDESARIKKIKGAIKGGNVKRGSTKKRLRGELHDLYGASKKRVAAYDKPLYGSNTSQRGLDDETYNAVEGQYGPARKSLESEVGAQGQRQSAIADFYRQYSDTAKAAGAAQAQMYANSVTASQGASDKATTTEKTANDDLYTKMQADAQRSGQQLDPSLFLQANQAVDARAQSANAGTDRLRAAATSNATYNSDTLRVGAAAQNYDTQREGRFTGKLRADLRDVTTKAGGAASEYRSKRDEQLFQRGLAAEALGVKATDAAADNQTAAERLKLDRQKASETNRHNEAMENKPTGGGGNGGGDKGGRTPTQIHNDKTTYKNSRYKIRRLKQQGAVKPGQGQKGIDYLVGKGVPEDLARAAVMDALYGGVDAKTRRAIRKQYGFGLRLSPSEKRKRRK